MHYASMCFERESRGGRGRAWEARTDVDPGSGAAQVREHEAPAAPAGGEGGEHPAQVGLPFLGRLRLVPAAAAGPNPHGAVHRLRVLLLRLLILMLLVASSSFRPRLPPLVAVGSSNRGTPWKW